MYGPLGPARRRSSVFCAAKYVSNIVSPCHRPGSRITVIREDIDLGNTRYYGEQKAEKSFAII
jgi:hypothetical protein